MGQHHKTQKYLGLSILLNIVITVTQAVGGVLSGSLALLSDALHNFSDVISLLISFVANRYARKAASQEKTFGYKRAEIIAAFINAASLIVLASFLIYESILRFITPEPIQANWVITLATLGIVVNGLSVLLLQNSASQNIHHLHVWQVNEYENHLEAHIDFNENISIADFDDILEKIEVILLNDFGINHVNIQPEYRKDDNKNIIVQD